ncbi:NADPH-dependent F420 reductase [Nonomuraea jabiensis]|uniref:Putative dinucleotide-binding enzyme n=1 Tax=Nonomuraea jabiensis TaxID=882448 RepID=A0A7W9GI29_9ACTN|nr:NAD(P)-binding domain-containing protein [Nonomuraea jabiensis]MBB5784209.1 putative dinucleotide-binding enzyme [Nonomuraea jabiensis]
MRIGILGAGGMADALGTQWARAGHEVMISGRDAAATATRAAAMTAEAARTRTEPAGTQTGVTDTRAGVADARAGVADARAGVAGTAAEVAGARGVAAGAAAAEVVGAPVGVVGADGQVAGARTEVVGVRAGSWAEAAAFGEVVMVAVRQAGLTGVLESAGAALRDKPLIDVANAEGPYDPAHPIAPLIRDLTGGHVVKAFNLCHVDVWRLTPPVFDGRPLAVPLCGDDPAALAAVRTLVADLGCTPVDGGGLDRAVLLEATAAFMIGLWFGGADAQAVLPPVAYSGA